MPMGLDAAIKKRTSGEFQTELHGGEQSFVQSSGLETSFSSKQSKSFQQSSSLKSSSSVSQQQFASSFSSNQSSSNQSSISATKFSSSQSSGTEAKFNQESSFTSQKQHQQQSLTNVSMSKTTTKDLGFDAASQHFGQEIQQNELKDKIESVITDLEQDKDFVDFSSADNNKAMITATNGSPAQTFSPPPFLAAQQKQASLELFSPPPLEPFEPPSSDLSIQSNSLPQRSTIISDIATESSYKQTSSSVTEMRQSTNINHSMNGDFHQEGVEVNQSVSQLAHVMNGGLQQEVAGEISNSSSSSLLQKIMTPAQVDYDSSSLKRRDPKKMFSDSSFYNSEKHPTVADQVEMAQKISKAMFSKDNKLFMNKAQNSVDGVILQSGAKHEDLSNLKLIMNPEGKVHEWNDMPADQLPNADLLAGHAVPAAAKLAGSAVKSAEYGEEVGKGGELFAKRREKADNWVVDESSIGKKTPSAFADKFVQEQTMQQQRMMESKMMEENQRQQIIQHQSAMELQQRQEQQQLSQQQFAAQQQSKQQQTFELRKQQELLMAESEFELPNNMRRTDLKSRGCATPGLDLGCHNSQGINVWANTAPRGWGTLKRESRQATSNESSQQYQMQFELERTQNEFEQNEREERMFLEKQQEALRIQKEEVDNMAILQQQEQMRVQREQEELFLLQQQQEQQRMQQEQMQMLQQQEEELRLRKEQEEMLILQQQQEKIRIQQEQEEQLRHQREQEELLLRKQQEEQLRIQREQEEKILLQQQQEQMRLQMEQEEKARLEQEQIRFKQEQEQIRIQEQMLIEQQKQKIQLEQEENQRIFQQQLQEQELEERKRKEYEAWFNNQQLEALEYMASVNYSTNTEEQQITEQRKEIQTSKVEITKRVDQQQNQETFLRGNAQSQSINTMNQQMSSGIQTNITSQQVEHNQQAFSQTSVQNAMDSYESRRVGYENVSQQSMQSITSSKVAKSGVLGGISGDSNNLVTDEVDYQKHSVKDLAKHFAAVKPKAEIPINVLPEIKMYNGQEAPNLNYLGANASDGQVKSTFTRKEVDQKELEASRLAYEEKKKKQAEKLQSSESSSSVSARQATDTKATKSVVSERRLSITSALMMDPAKQHAEAGIIDPSALLRGEGEGGVRTSGIIELAGAGGGATEEVANKWDNHNTIARGWAGVVPNYQPVTFRNIYNVTSQRA